MNRRREEGGTSKMLSAEAVGAEASHTVVAASAAVMRGKH